MLRSIRVMCRQKSSILAVLSLASHKEITDKCKNDEVGLGKIMIGRDNREKGKTKEVDKRKSKK